MEFRATENIALIKLLQREIRNHFASESHSASGDYSASGCHSASEEASASENSFASGWASAGENHSVGENSFASESHSVGENHSASRRDFAKTESISNSKIRRLIMAGQVSVNGKQIFVPSFNVHRGSFVSVKIDEEKFFAEKKPDDIEFTLTEKDVLYEDDVIIVVNKPARFPTEQTITGNRANLHDEIVRYLWEKNPSLRNPPYVGIMHRLDRDTSGAILFTKSRSVNKAIFQMFEERTMEKVYRAVASATSAGGNHSASGRHLASESSSASTKSFTRERASASGKSPASEPPYSFSVKNYLARENGKSSQAKWHSVSASGSSSASEKSFASERASASESHSVSSGRHLASGKNSPAKNALFAHTDFTVLRCGAFNEKDALFIEARPHTGRTHQIRVHLSESGMAIFGDTIYGGENAPRLMLHAYSLAFTHPTSDEQIYVTAPLPEGF